jgi:hypothetical protein
MSATLNQASREKGVRWYQDEPTTQALGRLQLRTGAAMCRGAETRGGRQRYSLRGLNVGRFLV